MEIYIKIFEVIFPVFFVIGVGYYLGRRNPKFDTNFITNFAGNIGTPAMIFYTVTTTGITLDIFIQYFLYSILMIGAFAVIGLILLFFLNKDLSMELPPLILPNTGNMGVPICLFAYGSQGLGVASAVASVIILFHFTLGVFLAKKSFSLDILIKSPPVYAIIISIFFLFYEIDPPIFLENTTFLLTYATIFLVLMSLGIALTRFKFSLKDSVILSLCRIIFGPIIAFVIIYYFNLSGFAAGVLLIQAAMPSAILNYLVGSMYSPKKVVDSIASTIVLSTLMSFITIPIVVFFALKYFN
ncbi:MAG: transporter [Candidatus Pelagibacter sp. TMED273]|nr:MAG: transporter [Candidatus Pelagibacter sp. TMED273]|tara:strand:+ start:3965 stop:4861 length:897 start_codon:yes stop_codon:yes gene_type:complete